MAFQYISKRFYPIGPLVAGEDWRELIPVKQSDGSAFDFTNWTIKAEVRTNPGNISVAVFDSTLGVPTIEIEGGDIYLVKPKLDTKSVVVGAHTWQCRFTDPDGVMRCLIMKCQFEVIELYID